MFEVTRNAHEEPGYKTEYTLDEQMWLDRQQLHAERLAARAARLTA